MNTPIRTLTYTVEADTISPQTPQFAGIAGDHLATRIVFHLDSALVREGVKYRFEYVDGMQTVDITDEVAVTDHQATVDLPAAWTQNGGQAKIRMMVTQPDEKGNPSQVFHTLSARFFLRI